MNREKMLERKIMRKELNRKRSKIRQKGKENREKTEKEHNVNEWRDKTECREEVYRLFLLYQRERRERERERGK